MILRYFLSVILLAFITQPVFAQIPVTPIIDPNCQELYQKGKVVVITEGPLSQTVSGIPLSYETRLVNLNQYPVVDSVLRMSLLRNVSDKDQKYPQWETISETIITDPLTLKVQEDRTIPLSFDLPTYLETGEYALVGSVFTHDGRQLSETGLSPFLIRDAYRFQIVADSNIGGVTISSILQDGKNRSRSLSSTSTPTFSFALENNNIDVAGGNAILTLYADRVSKDRIISVSSFPVTIDSGEEETLEFVLSDTSRTSYILELSFLNMVNNSTLTRYISIERTPDTSFSIDFASLASYPDSGGETELFACISGKTQQTDTVVMTLSQQDGTIIHSSKIDGQALASSTPLIRIPFSLTSINGDLLLKTEAFRGGEVIDNAVLTYPCAELIGSDKCVKKRAEGDGATDRNFILSLALPITLILIIAALGAFLFYRTRHYPPSQTPPTSTL